MIPGYCIRPVKALPIASLVSSSYRPIELSPRAKPLLKLYFGTPLKGLYIKSSILDSGRNKTPSSSSSTTNAFSRAVKLDPDIDELEQEQLEKEDDEKDDELLQLEQDEKLSDELDEELSDSLLLQLELNEIEEELERLLEQLLLKLLDEEQELDDTDSDDEQELDDTDSEELELELKDSLLEQELLEQELLEDEGKSQFVLLPPSTLVPSDASIVLPRAALLYVAVT